MDGRTNGKERWDLIKENKKVRKQELDKESDQENKKENKNSTHL